MVTVAGIKLYRWYQEGVTDYDQLVDKATEKLGKGWNRSLVMSALTNARRHLEG